MFWLSGFLSNTNLKSTTRSKIFIINICTYDHPFEVFVARKNKGVGDLKCGEVGEIN